MAKRTNDGWLENIKTLLFAGLIAIGIRTVAYEPFNIPSGSMKATLLVGDYLFAKSLEIGAQLGAQTANLLAKAYVDMTAGQALEMSDLFNQERTINSYMQTIDGKSVALIAAACQIGGVCADLSDKKQAALADYGKYFGRR